MTRAKKITSCAALVAALRYADGGCSVLPCRSDKKPFLPTWLEYQERQPTETEVRAWFARWPGARVAIVTGAVSGLVVVDVDDPADEALDEALARFGDTPRIATTPSGGCHCYYSHPGQPVANAVRVEGLAHAIDLRGDGGYVLAPPSPGYSWLREARRSELPTFKPLELAPTQSQATPAAATRSTWRADLIGVEAGRRNDTLARLVGGMLREGSSPEVAELAALEWARRCRPPLPAAEVRVVVASISARDASGDLEDDEDDVRELKLPTCALRGTFAATVDYLKPATGANPAHVFAATWAALATCIGGARFGSWSGRVVASVYALCVGPTGDHKSSGADRVLALLPDSVRRVDGATSDAGLFDSLEDAAGCPVLFNFDELGLLLRMASLSGSTLDSLLNRLWSAPAQLDRNLSKLRGGQGARRVERPFACLLGGTHAETFWRTMSDPSLAIASGFVNRIAPFVVERGRSLAVTREPDERAAAALRAKLESLTRLQPGPVSLAPAARGLWVDFSRDHDRRVGSLSPDRAAVTKRVRDHVARLSLVYATDSGRQTIELENLRPAIEVGAFIEAGYARLLLGRQPERGPGRAAALERIARRLLGLRPGVAQTVRSLIRGWPNQDRPSSAELRRVLASMDGLAVLPGRGRSRERYRRAGGSTTPSGITQRKDRGLSVELSGSPIGCNVPIGGGSPPDEPPVEAPEEPPETHTPPLRGEWGEPA